MTIDFLKKQNAVKISAKSGTALILINPVDDPRSLLNLDLEEIDIIFVTAPKTVYDHEAEFTEWGTVTEEMFKKSTLLVYSPGEFRMRDFFIKGSFDDSAVQYAIETPEGWIGILSGKPTEAYIKKWAPLDIIIGSDVALSDVQLDFEPFYVILTSMSVDYMKKTGMTEVKKTDKVSIKKLDPAAREGTISAADMTVVQLG